MSKTVSDTGLRAMTHAYAGNSFGPSSEGVILPKEGIGTDCRKGSFSATLKESMGFERTDVSERGWSF